MTYRVFLLAVAALSLTFLSACGHPKVYKEESFEFDSPYRQQVDRPVEIACNAARLALLGQGYTLEVEESNRLKGNKAFQPDEEINAIIEFNVVCTKLTEGSLIFANAVQTLYQLKETSDTASIGVKSIGSIKLPWGKTTESLVKVGSETICDKKFYKRFFDLVEKNL